MTFIISLFMSRFGASKRVATIAFWAFAAALLLIILGTAKCAYDASIIEDHDAKIEVEAARADRAADAEIEVLRREDEVRVDQEIGQLEKVQANASTPLDRRLAKHRCIRLQQAARADGSKPPTCI